MNTPFVDKSPHRRDSAGARTGSWLKQRLAQILTRSSCAAATNSDATAFVSLAKANNAEEAPPSPYFCTPCTYERPTVDGAGGGRPRHRHRTRSASLVHISVDCTGGSAVGASGRRSVRSDAPLLQHRPSSVPAWDGVRKQSTRRSKTAAARSPPPASRRHCSSTAESWGPPRRPRRTLIAPYSSSLSAASYTATDDELAPFRSDDDDKGRDEAETRTLFSSPSFSSDSTSDFYQTNSNIGGNKNSTRTTRRGNNTTRHAPRRALARTSVPTPADAFRPLISVEADKRGGCNDRKAAKEETVKEDSSPGMAVVKRSSNPYADFRSSMVEMVVERRIARVEQMEDLLGSYLSLNSSRHHPAILAAFEDVWEAVFGRGVSATRPSGHSKVCWPIVR